MKKRLAVLSIFLMMMILFTGSCYARAGGGGSGSSGGSGGSGGGGATTHYYCHDHWLWRRNVFNTTKLYLNQQQLYAGTLFLVQCMA